MTLEVLFARQAQGEAFLLMAALGLALGALLQGAGAVNRHHRLLGMAADLLIAVLLTAAILVIALMTGTGLRLYALLGLCIGAALYLAGIGRSLRWLWQKMPRQRHAPPRDEDGRNN